MENGRRPAVEWAVRLAHLGLLIFPLCRGAKEPPRGESWVDIMTSDEGAIRRWFDERPGMNYGVCPGPRHVVVDLDVKEHVNGVSALSELQADQEIDDWVLGQTLTVATPSGGRHLYLGTQSPASNRHRFPAGVDIRGVHGYVVGPGCELVEGQCKETDTPGDYTVEIDCAVAPAPAWVEGLLRRGKDQEKSDLDPVFELDLEDAVRRGREFLRHRDPAVEGLGGDHHTLMTAMCLIDFGLSEMMTLDLLTEPFEKDGEWEAQSWNERCSPPWDINGRKGTLEEKVRNAWRYREREPGTKGGAAAFDDDDYLKDIVDIATMNAEEKETRFARIRDHLFRGGKIFKRGKRREFVVPEWLPAHGMAALLARRGGGKTVIMLDLALRIASDMDWHGRQVKPGFHVVYLAGEDDEGAEEQIRAWCIQHGLDAPPERFIFLDIITDLMSADDVREWTEALREEIGQKSRAVVFLDTWQRAASRGGQNKDEDMQKAVHHAEALARSLNGPAVVAFHPPKHDDRMVMGSSVIENSTTAIWNLTDHTNGRRLEVTRIKGRGIGCYQLFRFEQISLGEKDEFGEERTGVVPLKLGGVEGSDSNEGDTEGEVESRRAFAYVLRELELRRKEEDPNSTKHYATTRASKIISEELPAKEEAGDEWAAGLMNQLRDAGTINLRSWKRVNERIIELFGNDPRGYDFGDGYALRVYRDKTSRRVKVDKSGISP